MPEEVKEKLFAIDSFREHFSKEIEQLKHEKEYRARVQTILQQYYSNFDEYEVRSFLSKEIKQNKWGLFNHIFIRKAIDFSLDKGANEKEACSKLLAFCTQEFNF